MYDERNSEIIKMIDNGEAVKVVAEKFNISPERVNQIIKKNKENIIKTCRINTLIKNIRDENKLGAKYSVELIAESLQLAPITIKALNNYFNNAEITIFEFMDAIITQKLEPDMSFFEAIPIFNQKNIGKKTVINIINHLSNSDLGDDFNHEWSKRREELQNYLVSINYPMFMLYAR